jgi:hypothetical protein
MLKMKSATDDFTGFSLPLLLDQFFTNCSSIGWWPNWELSDHICLARPFKKIANVKIC